MRLQKTTVNRSNNGFQEVTRRRGGGRGGGYGRGDKPGRGPPGREGRGGRGESKEKGDKIMENSEKERKVDADSNGDDEWKLMTNWKNKKTALRNTKMKKKKRKLSKTQRKAKRRPPRKRRKENHSLRK
eukprot:scaffold68194_cov58-Attheya_sp.AAC.13